MSGLLFDSAHWHLVPEHLRPGLDAHIAMDRPVGGFLTAALSNDLAVTVLRADEESLAGLHGLVRFLYRHAPARCWGSPSIVVDWRVSGGLAGAAPAGSGEDAS